MLGLLGLKSHDFVLLLRSDHASALHDRLQHCQTDGRSQSVNKQPSLKTCIFDLQALCRRGSASLLALFQLSASANVYKGL